MCSISYLFIYLLLLLYAGFVNCLINILGNKKKYCTVLTHSSKCQLLLNFCNVIYEQKFTEA